MARARQQALQQALPQRPPSSQRAPLSGGDPGPRHLRPLHLCVRRLVRDNQALPPAKRRKPSGLAYREPLRASRARITAAQRTIRPSPKGVGLP